MVVALLLSPLLSALADVEICCHERPLMAEAVEEVPEARNLETMIQSPG